MKLDKADFLGRDALDADGGTARRPPPPRLHACPAPRRSRAAPSSHERRGGRASVTSSFDSPMLEHAVLLGWLRHRPFAERRRDRRSPGHDVLDPLLRPGGIAVREPEPFAGWRVVATPPALDALEARTGQRVACGSPPTTLLVLSGGEQPVLDDPDAIVEPETGFAGWELDPPAVRALLVRHVEWQLPARAPDPGPGSGGGGTGQAVAAGGRFGAAVVPARRTPPSWRRGWRERVRRDAAGPHLAGHARAEAVLRRGHHRRRRAWPVDRVPPGHSPRHHRRRRSRREYIGSGNSGRNTTIIRANYGLPEAVRFYQHSLELYQQLEDETGAESCTRPRGSSGWPTRSPPPVPSGPGRC